MAWGAFAVLQGTEHEETFALTPDQAALTPLATNQNEVTVSGRESPGRYQELAAAVDEHCPVLDLFKNPVPVTRALAG